jgi:hypothetical protein
MWGVMGQTERLPGHDATGVAELAAPSRTLLLPLPRDPGESGEEAGEVFRRFFEPSPAFFRLPKVADCSPRTLSRRTASSTARRRRRGSWR